MVLTKDTIGKAEADFTEHQAKAWAHGDKADELQNAIAKYYEDRADPGVEQKVIEANESVNILSVKGRIIVHPHAQNVKAAMVAEKAAMVAAL